MILQVLVKLPDGHEWTGELEVDPCDYTDDRAIDLEDDDIRTDIDYLVADWLFSEQLDWR